MFLGIVKGYMPSLAGNLHLGCYNESLNIYVN